MLIKSSRRLIKSSFVIEHWDPLLPQTQYVGYNDEGLAGVYDINDALQFNTKEEAKQFIKEHDEEYGGILKIHEYPSYVQNSRRPVESGRRQEVSNKDFINKLKSMKSKGWSTSVVGYYENDLDTDEQRLYVSGGEYTFTNNDDERRKLSRQIMALNGGEGIGYKKGNFEDVINSSRRPIKSANYNGFNLEARRSYGKGNRYFTTYPVWDTDLDTSIGAIEYHYAVENPYYVAWVYDDFGVNKTGRTKAFDTEEECLEWIGEELASGTTARDKLLKYWEELGYDYKSKNLNNSRKPVKSSFIVGKTMNDGSKLYYCEDNCFYDENNYSRPDIKVFDNEVDAKKIAKRSKSGFVSPLEK